MSESEETEDGPAAWFDPETKEIVLNLPSEGDENADDT